MKVTRAEIDSAYTMVSEKEISIVKLMKKQIEEYESVVLERNNFSLNQRGINIRCETRPIRSVGCYIPGGKAVYPSTVLMTVIPAKIAGVPRIVITTPPSLGKIDPLILVTADLCQVNEIYKIGGVQSIGALAYGTKTIKKVQKIVGPGNIYVTIAKKLVSQQVQIDVPAGPSEILVIADESANSKFIALDMIAQAEHGPYGSMVLVTESQELGNKVKQELNDLSKECPRKELVRDALERGGCILVLESMDECIDFVNKFAPEHLEIMADNSVDIINRVNNAGLILDGNYSPVALSDYLVGTNHVLPTNGYGAICSGLSSLDFVKRMNIVNCSKQNLKEMVEPIQIITSSEHLYNHALSIERRFYS